MASGAAAKPAKPNVVTAGDLDAYLRSLDVNRLPVDASDYITWGPHDRPIKRIATMWMGTSAAMRAAAAAGCNIAVVHEPIFYSYADLTTMPKREYDWATAPVVARFDEARMAKQRLLDDLGITVIRCHDMIDRARSIGVADSWARALGFGPQTLIARQPYYQSHRIDPARAIDVAGRIAKSAARLGQPGVEFYGDPDRIIRSVGTGTGAISSPLSILALDPMPDMTVSITDSVKAWIEPAFAQDSGRPMVIVNHGTTEEGGMAALAAFLSGADVNLPVTHIPGGAFYRWVQP